MKTRQTVMAIAMGLASLFIAPLANASIIFDNQNPGHVFSGPASPFITFTLSTSTFITLIDTYHYDTPLVSDTFTIKNADTAETVFSTSAITDNFSPYDHYQATPNVTLAAGTYKFFDANVSSWSYNYDIAGALPDCAPYNCSNTDNTGFTEIVSGIAPTTAVPEPATWAMFLAGFGGVGFTMRGLRRKAVAATA